MTGLVAAVPASPAGPAGRIAVVRMDRSGLPAVVPPGGLVRILRLADSAGTPRPAIWVESVMISGRWEGAPPPGRRLLARVRVRLVVGGTPGAGDLLEPCGPGASIAWVGAGRGILVDDEDLGVEVVNEGDAPVVVDLAVAVGRLTTSAVPPLARTGA